MSGSKAIEDKLSLKHAELADLDRRREIVLVQIQAYEDALRMVIGSADLVASPATVEGQLRVARSKPHRARGLSKHWKKILRRVASASMTFRYNDVIQAVQAEKRKIGRETLRSQILGYVKSGYLERISDGVFRFTQQGADAIGVKFRKDEPPGGETPSGSNDSEGAAGSPSGSPSQVPGVGSSPTVSTSSFRRDLLTSAALPGFALATGERH
jgi:hypothetical protein